LNRDYKCDIIKYDSQDLAILNYFRFQDEFLLLTSFLVETRDYKYGSAVSNYVASDVQNIS